MERNVVHDRNHPSKSHNLEHTDLDMKNERYCKIAEQIFAKQEAKQPGSAELLVNRF